MSGVVITATTPDETTTALATDDGTPSSSETVEGVKAESAGGSLPRTGSDVTKPLVLSGLMLAVGALLLRLSGMSVRRVRQH